MAENPQHKNDGTIELVWFGPFSFRDFIEESERVKDFKVRGVYLWVEKGEAGEERISYVGKVSGEPNLLKRQRDHYANLIGGGWTIPGGFRSGKGKWEPHQYPENVGTVLSCDKFVELVRAAFQYVQCITIYLAPLGQLSSEVIGAVERNQLYDLKPTYTNPGTKSEPRQRLRIVHKNARWYTEDVKRYIRNQPMIA